MKRSIGWVMLVFVLTLGACGAKDTADDTKAEASDGETLELRVGVVVGDWSPHYKAAEAWAKQLDEESDGKIKLKIFPDGQLGGEREMFEAVQKGSLDVGLLSSSVYSAFEPKMSVLDIPFLVSDFDEAEKLMAGPVGEELDKLLLANGVRNLAWAHNDFRIITNNKQPIEKPEDLSAVKMRVPESKVLADWYKELGTMAVPMPFPDIYTALQQKVVDGQDNGPILSFAAKFFEHQKYLTVSNHQYSPIGFLFSDSVWAKLTDQQKELLESTAAEAAEIEMQAIREFNETAIKSMEEAGLETTYLDGEQLKAFKETTMPFLDDIRTVAGDELMDLVLKEAGYESQ